jgi:hypothetical protein
MPYDLIREACQVIGLKPLNHTAIPAQFVTHLFYASNLMFNNACGAHIQVDY